MAHGGGTWVSQNKRLPGTYVNFASAIRASATLSDRGIAAVPVALSWGPVGEVRMITNGDFQKDSFNLFGYDYAADEMLPLRELFLHATKAFVYRLAGSGHVNDQEQIVGADANASCTYATAKYPGVRGNDIRITIEPDPDNTHYFIVRTLVGAREVDRQSVNRFCDLVDNDWVVWIKSIDVVEYSKTSDVAIVEGKTYYTKEGDVYTEVAEPNVSDIGDYYEASTVKRYYHFAQTAGTGETGVPDTEDGKSYVTPAIPAAGIAGINLTGGVDGENSAADHQAFLAAIEPYAFNTMCCPSLNSGIISLYVSNTKRVRDDLGKKYQLVAWQSNADYEGVIGLWSESHHETITSSIADTALLYWLTGAEAGCLIKSTLTNSKYDGELTVNVSLSQSQLEEAMEKGRFVFHNVNGEVRVLEDINTFVSVTKRKDTLFQMNQTIRVCDQIANDIAVLFNTIYLGKVPNNANGRAALWNDIFVYLQELERLEAIQNLNPDNIKCAEGSKKKAVYVLISGLNIVNAMSQLYMDVEII